MELEMRVMDQFVNEEGSDQERMCWRKIRSAICEANSNAVLYEGWRDANKEFPEIEQAVLVYFSGAYCVMMRLKYISPKGETVIKWSDGNRSFIGVDAWRPLPDPPAFV